MQDAAPAVAQPEDHRRPVALVVAFVVAFVSAVIAALLVVLALVVLQDSFRIGATASGLNPNGGGPGVLLMAPPAIAAFLFARFGERRGLLHRHPVVISVAVLGAAVQCIILFTVGGAVLPSDFPSLESPASAAALAWIVPIAVMTLLSRL